MSVLSDLFQDIADAIGEKTGDPDKPLSPADFPSEILSIVAGGTSGEGTGGGDLEDGTFGDLKFASGSFVSPETGFGRVTVRHELGVLPDFIMVYHAKRALEEDVEYIADTCPLLFTYNVRNGLRSVYGAGDLSFLNDYASHGLGFENKIDSIFDGREYGAAIHCKSDTTFTVGNAVNIDGKYGFIPNTTYNWLAISGMGGAVSGESVHLRYVTFLNYDGTELGKKAVAVGDDCANPISRNIFSTPTRESTAQYNYTFSGWSTTQGGGANSNALESVDTDRTLYAAYTSAVRYYTITYYDSDGTTVLHTESLKYGTMPGYVAEKTGFGFVGWKPQFATVTEDASYIAEWAEKITFANASWEDIDRISASGEAENTFAVGDTKEITYNGSTMQLMIAGFNHDDLADGSGKAGISIVFNNLTTNKVTRSKATDEYNSYDKLSAYINRNSSASVWYYLPETLKAVIKPVIKRYVPESKTSSGLLTDADTTTISEKLWCLSAGEMGVNLTVDAATPLLGTTYEVFEGCVGLSYPDGFSGKGKQLKLIVPVAGKTTIASGMSGDIYWIRNAYRTGSHQPMIAYTNSNTVYLELSNTSRSGYFRCGFCI